MPLAVWIAQEIAQALAYAHRARDGSGRGLGIVHRDVSPQNVLLGVQGDVKLADFGLADATLHEHVRAENTVGGKIAYLSPEIVRGQASDHRADLFALGVVFWEMLAGRPLFTGGTDAQTIRRIAECEVPNLAGLVPDGEQADTIVRRLVTKDPDQRLNDAALLASQMRQLIDRKQWPVGRDLAASAVRRYLSEKTRRSQAPPVSTLLADELAKFAEVAADRPLDLGALPLDPSKF